FSRPTRFRSPHRRNDEFDHADPRSPDDSSRRPLPLYNRFDIVPPSQNAAPLGPPSRPSKPLTSVVRPFAPVVCRVTQKLTLPAPPAINPSFGRYVEPVCSASLIW